MAQYDEEQAVCEARIAELKKELDVVETTKVDLKRFIKLIQKYKNCETLTDEMLYELVEKVVIHSASGGRTIYRQQQIDIYFNLSVIRSLVKLRLVAATRKSYRTATCQA